MRRADVQALFRAERAAFEEALGDVIPRHELPRLVISDADCTGPLHCSERDLAYAVQGRRPRVVLLARALRLPRKNIVGLIRHELGHVYDPTPRRRGAEQRADDLTEWVHGTRIKYDARLIQTIGEGTYPRPRVLHA